MVNDMAEGVFVTTKLGKEYILARWETQVLGTWDTETDGLYETDLLHTLWADGKHNKLQVIQC